MLLTGNEIVCPRGQAGLEPILIDIKAISGIENRIHEVAVITPHKAPELLAAFNIGYLMLHQNITTLERERLLGERRANRIKAVILLDKVPNILKEKGLTNARSPGGSEDLRNAILAADDEYQEAVDVVEQITCVMELLKGKMKSIEMAYTSVKKILGESNTTMLNRLSALSGDTGSNEAGFGTSK